MARLADSYLRSTLSFNGLDSVLIRFCFIQSLLNISVPQMGTNGALALAPAAPSTPPTNPVTVKKIRIIYSTTDEALEHLNKERETETLPHWYDKVPDPTLIGMSSRNNRYKLHFAKKSTFILVGMVVDHDVNIKKEVSPCASSSQF